ncbi:MAG: AAA family ATPase [Alphaproteobacteria bacterium]|nr:AAA family ATPase [Alphaproteobacteria bacterium]
MTGARDVVVPVVAAYRNSRAVIETPQTRRNFKTEFNRFHGLDGALTATANFRQVIEWLVAEEDIERRERENRRDWNYRSPLLDAVRRAVETLMPGCRNLRVEVRPLRVDIDRDMDERGDHFETLSLDELSDGYRIMLALVIDLAHRMATTNPFMEDPLTSPAIVLIDEVDLHLHPRWQQRVLDDLRRVFPNTQFIVSTHSPQVLTTVAEHQIVILGRDGDGRIVRHDVEMDPYGAESGRVLEAIFGVDQRPPGELNAFVRDLAACWDLIEANRFDEPEAQRKFDDLKRRAPQDPVILRLDLEMRRRRGMIARGQTP